jgi:hypothetical protein
VASILHLYLGHVIKGAEWCVRSTLFRCIAACLQCLLFTITIPFRLAWCLLETYCFSLTFSIKWHFERTFPRPFKHRSHQFKTESKTASSQPEELNLHANCICDAPSDVSDEIEVVCLPVLRRNDSSYDGLILQLVQGETNRYERLGTFTTSNYQLSRLSQSFTKQTFILI